MNLVKIIVITEDEISKEAETKVRLALANTYKDTLELSGFVGDVEIVKRIGETASKSVPPAETTEKFALLVDLGIITVPDDYDHASRLKMFIKQNRKKFCYYNDDITDKNFPNPTRILKPGDKLRVRAFKQVIGGTTTSEERMTFLATKKAVHTGAQGISLVFEQKRDQLPKDKWYASFDEPDRLLYADGYRRVPGVRCVSDGDFDFDLGGFEDVWNGGFAFLCFCDIE